MITGELIRTIATYRAVKFIENVESKFISKPNEKNSEIEYALFGEIKTIELKQLITQKEFDGMVIDNIRYIEQLLNVKNEAQLLGLEQKVLSMVLEELDKACREVENRRNGEIYFLDYVF